MAKKDEGQGSGDVQKEKKAKKPELLLVEQGAGLAALSKAVANVPKAPTGAERLRQARAEREKAVRDALTPEVVAVINAFRQKGYGWGVVAKNVSAALGLKVSADYLKRTYGQKKLFVLASFEGEPNDDLLEWLTKEGLKRDGNTTAWFQEVDPKTAQQRADALAKDLAECDAKVTLEEV